MSEGQIPFSGTLPEVVRRLFTVMFGREAFLRDGADRRSFHDRARAEAAFYEERVAASLSKLVFEQVFPSLATAIAAAVGGELLYNEALRNAQRSAEAMKTIEALTDVEIAEAHRPAAMYQDVELMTGELDGFVSFIHALDWLDLKAKEDKALVRLWLDGRFGDPIPIARGRKAPEGGKTKSVAEVERFTEIWKGARSLIGEERFPNWQIRFPGVWSNWASKGREGGFDAVVGNPPWGPDQAATDRMVCRAATRYSTRPTRL